MKSKYVTEEKLGLMLKENFQIFSEATDKKIDESMEKQRQEYQRYVGVLSEEFRSCFGHLADMVIHNGDKIDTLRADLVQKGVLSY